MQILLANRLPLDLFRRLIWHFAFVPAANHNHGEKTKAAKAKQGLPQTMQQIIY